jgi:hypothetical protein
MKQTWRYSNNFHELSCMNCIWTVVFTLLPSCWILVLSSWETEVSGCSAINVATWWTATLYRTGHHRCRTWPAGTYMQTCYKHNNIPSSLLLFCSGLWCSAGLNKANYLTGWKEIPYILESNPHLVFAALYCSYGTYTGSIIWPKSCSRSRI